ncbi:PFL_4695 family integrating conjugative element protein [Endozoicomonas sp. ALC066]|uniref:PFL_4695 family integrating conjugative element protein n=1 Tax=Endozoicomonas sp. ALC066 TaxID=3403078 RepID=UPI003BB603E8
MVKPLIFSLGLLLIAPVTVIQAMTVHSEKKTVIYDGGGVSIEPYLSVISSEDKAGNPIPLKPPYISPRQAALPVSTPEMSVGRLPEKFIQKKTPGMAYPFVIVGADQASVDWLAANKGQLAKVGAIGLVVNVETESQLEALEGVSGIQMSPVNGSDFVRIWGIRNYPALITQEGIYQ